MSRATNWPMGEANEDHPGCADDRVVCGSGPCARQAGFGRPAPVLRGSAKEVACGRKGLQGRTQQNTQSEAGRSLGQGAMRRSAYSTLPGLRMLFGSSVRLSVFINS